MNDLQLSHNDIIQLRFVRRKHAASQLATDEYYISIIKNGIPVDSCGPYDRVPTLADALLWVGTQLKLGEN